MIDQSITLDTFTVRLVLLNLYANLRTGVPFASRIVAVDLIAVISTIVVAIAFFPLVHAPVVFASELIKRA